MRVVLCNAPPQRAEEIARALVERHLAACVNVVPGVVSVYRWKGAVEREEESTLLIKTAEERMPELVAALRALHPYEVPEILSLPVIVDESHPDYVAWVLAESRAPVTGRT